MKKIIMVFSICILVVLSAYVIRQQNIDISGSIKSFSNQIKGIFKEDNIEFNNDFKVNFLQRNISDHRFNNLTSEQKLIYSSIAKGVKELKKDVEISEYKYIDEDTTTLDVSESIQAFFDDHPEVFYLNSTYSLYVSNKLLYKTVNVGLSYTVENMEELEKELNKIENIVKNYISKINNNMPVFEKELVLHNELGQDVSYYSFENIDKIPDLYHSIKGSFIEKSAVCDGISKALQILYDKAGIETMLISGTLENEPHAWVLVNLNNQWYHVDLTSNKLIKQKYNNKSIVVHSYFNITDKKISKTHLIDKHKIYPTANSETLEYYRVTKNYIYLSDNFGQKLKEIITRQTNSNILEFATDRGDDIPTKMSNVLYETNFNNYRKKGVSSINYYNILSSFVILK